MRKKTVLPKNPEIITTLLFRLMSGPLSDFMEIIYTKIAQPHWCLKVAAWMIILIYIHARFVSPFMGNLKL
jgi:hypothetical protein